MGDREGGGDFVRNFQGNRADAFVQWLCFLDHCCDVCIAVMCAVIY